MQILASMTALATLLLASCGDSNSPTVIDGSIDAPQIDAPQIDAAQSDAAAADAVTNDAAQSDAAAADAVITDAIAIDALPPDAATDAAISAVQVVSCVGNEAVLVVNAGMSYSPNVITINNNDIIKFQLSAGHNAVDDGGAFSVGFGATTCLQFTQVTSYLFRCTTHQFTGTITVQ